MNRLRSELHRLYAPLAAPDSVDPAPPVLIDADGQVRALVMEVSKPADWEVLGKVWHGVQTELELPAPGIAVSGTDGLQLWFSVREPIAASEAQAFLEALRARFLPDIATQRIRLLPASTGGAWLHADLVPSPAGSSGNWSAFVAADLAPVFADTPWLDIPPSEEGQASLLRALERIEPAAFHAARERLARATPVSPLSAAERPAPPIEPPLPSPPTADGSASDPAHFLLRVMRDDTVPLALRIDAAKALLQHGQRR